VIDLIESIKQEVDEFCITEETIYKACGMPTRFKVAFSCAFSEFDEELSEKQFKKILINKFDDLYSPEIKEYLQARAKVFKIFDGGDRVRLYRTGRFLPEDIIRELNIILNSYQLPFICYNFGKLKGGNLKITEFM